MSYYREKDVRLLIENCVAWSGDGARQGPSGCIVLRALRVINRELAAPRLPVTLGIEAGRTQAALAVMVPKLRFALMVFHTSDLTFELQARDRLHVSKSTYHRRLEEAHPQFIEQYDEQRERWMDVPPGALQMA